MSIPSRRSALAPRIACFLRVSDFGHQHLVAQRAYRILGRVAAKEKPVADAGLHHDFDAIGQTKPANGGVDIGVDLHDRDQLAYVGVADLAHYHLHAVAMGNLRYLADPGLNIAGTPFEIDDDRQPVAPTASTICSKTSVSGCHFCGPGEKRIATQPPSTQVCRSSRQLRK